MKRIYFGALLIGGLVSCVNPAAETITLTGLPDGDTDTLSIQLDPVGGALDGLAGGTVGCGFAIDWTSTAGDWISFTGTSLGSVDQGGDESGSSEKVQRLPRPQGGPTDFGLSPGDWAETFDGVSQGVGAYVISSDPTVAFARRRGYRRDYVRLRCL